MSFLFPLFLLAGLLVAVPILIHLFNLRRYKTVYFPSIRFLKSIQLHSQKQSQLRYKWLLALRILFLLSLVLAFAQPFYIRDQQAGETNRLQVIYLDNSSSMSVKKGVRSLLDIAKDAARQQLQAAAPGSRFILLTNDRPVNYQPLEPERVLAGLEGVEISPASRQASQLFATVQGLVQTEAAGGADVYYYSDFQQNSFPGTPAGLGLEDIEFYGIPVREAVANVYIDTAFLTAPVLLPGQNNRIAVRSRIVGKAPAEVPVLQLSVNGQVKTAAGLDFREQTTRMDTLSFQISGAGWQRLMLTVNDAAVRFDDTFRVAARSGSGLSVLTLNEGQPNAYIQAAFRSYPGFRLEQKPLGSAADWEQYNLVILNGLTRIDANLSGKIGTALQLGQTVCIFPGRTEDAGGLNEGLSRLAAISISGIDTAVQTAATLQSGSDLARDLFDRIPENVQLPVANWHYRVQAGLSANQQSVLSFRNGDPLLAQYTPSRGRLYLLTTGLDLASGNFPGSYFFVPFLYQMAAQSTAGDVFALTAGKPDPLLFPMRQASERNIVHVYGEGLDLIPPQRPSGNGVAVYLGQVIRQPGYYTLAAPGADSAVAGLNQDRQESELALWEMDALRKGWDGRSNHWLSPADLVSQAAAAGSASFPLWKVCVILALLMLAAESYLLAGSYRKKTVAPR